MSTRAVRLGIAAIALGVVAGTAAAVSAAGGGGGGARDGDDGHDGVIHEQLSGYEEAPLALSTPGNGKFRATVTNAGITYTLSYGDLSAPVTQAHIHFGATGQVGGITVWLCSNLASPPTPTGIQPCPQGAATVSGMVGPTGVVGPAGQGIAAGDYAELVAAIDNGTAYVNVHSTAFPGGEIRAQIENGHEGHQH